MLNTHRPDPPKDAEDLTIAYQELLVDDRRRRAKAAEHVLNAWRFLAPVTLAILLATSAYLWLSLILGDQVPVARMAVTDSHALRRWMLVATQLIDDYQLEHRQLPPTLADAGLDPGHVHYAITAIGYTLSGIAGDSIVTLDWTSASPGEVQLEAYAR